MKIRRFVFFVLVVLLFVSKSVVFSADVTKVLQQKMSTSFINTSLEKVVRILGTQYGLNIIVGGNASGRVTIQLSNVTLGEALNAILKAQGYHYVISGNVIYVKPLKMDVIGELKTKVFHLKYLDGLRLKLSLLPMLSAKGKMEALLSDGNADGKAGQSNTLIVTDFRENLEAISSAIEQMDYPAKEMQIEVRLIEKLIGDEKRVGLDLPKSVTVRSMGAETTAPITKTSQGGGGGEQTILSAWYHLPNTIENLNMGVLTFDGLRATLDLLAEDANSRLVSKPSVTTLDNRKAIIKIGQNIPVPEVSRGISGDLVSYKEKEVSMTLEVTPHIGLNNDITLDIHPILEEIIGYTGSSDAPQPITSKREVKSTVILKDGQTLVIGGLIKETENKNVSKIWLLGDIPILGYLFSHTSIKKQKSDLYIFITTKIFDPATQQNRVFKSE